MREQVARFGRRQEAGVLLALVGAVMLFGLLNPNFLTPANFSVILRALAYPGLMAIGMAFCLLSGTIDLAVGATAGLAAVVMAQATVNWQWSTEAGVGLGLLVGLCVGLLNAVLVLRLHVSAFIGTIGVMFALRGLISWLSNGYLIYPLPASLAAFGEAHVGGVSWAFWLLLAGLVLGGLALERTVWGLCVRATGSDRVIAFDTEVAVDRINLSTFVLSGLCAALAGMCMAAKIGGASPLLGQGAELPVIAACVVGGISLTGYTGSMASLFLGLLLTQVILNGIVVSGVNPYLQNTVLGGLLIVAVWLDTARRRKLGLNQ